jgi:predicted nucleic acid-binding protein
VTPDLHFVFDTNAIVSALLFKSSVPGQAFATAMERGKFLFSQATFLELNDVLRRKKLAGSARCLVTGDQDLLALHHFVQFQS